MADSSEATVAYMRYIDDCRSMLFAALEDENESLGECTAEPATTSRRSLIPLSRKYRKYEITKDDRLVLDHHTSNPLELEESLKLSVEGTNIAKKRVETQAREYKCKMENFVNRLVEEHHATEANDGVEAGLVSSSSMTPSKVAAAGFSLAVSTAASSAAGE